MTSASARPMTPPESSPPHHDCILSWESIAGRFHPQVIDAHICRTNDMYDDVDNTEHQQIGAKVVQSYALGYANPTTIINISTLQMNAANSMNSWRKCSTSGLIRVRPKLAMTTPSATRPSTPDTPHEGLSSIEREISTYEYDTDLNLGVVEHTFDPGCSS